jgi:hypothetical protein
MSTVVGSVTTPVIAASAAISGLTRYTWASLVPLRPSKFRLLVRSETAWLFGLWWLPMQNPQALSRILAPLLTQLGKNAVVGDHLQHFLLPGATPRLTVGATT